MRNPATLIDAYKADHRRQYPDGTENVYSNFTPRTSRIPEIDKVVFLGLQFFLQKFLMEEYGNFFAGDIDAECARYERRMNTFLGPNDIGSEHIRALHKLGYLPLTFSAVPEGTQVPLRVPMVVVEATDERFGWLVNYMETLMSSVIWMPCTSATTAMRLRELLVDYAVGTGSPVEFVDWQGHDFSFRGMAGPEAASLSAIGHLVAFTGTDTIPAIDLIEDYYGDNAEQYLIGGSVAATEHSVMCAGGADDERETFRRLIDLYPSGILSVVSDTWNLWNVIENILPSLYDEIMARDGKLVIRPDSGDPVAIISGDPNAEPGTPEYKGVIELLWDIFGGTTTDEGYRILDSHIGAIYGDSITYDRAERILANLQAKGFASANIVFGVGSYTYQFTTRDTFGFAMKATWVQINGEGMPIYKDPVTDNGTKKSAKGRLAVLEVDGNLVLVDGATPEQENESALVEVWRDGDFVEGGRTTFADIRARARA
mgnify:CR=1 FL=1